MPFSGSPVARVQILSRREELFLQQPWAGETEHGIRRASLVIGTARTTTAEALLSDERGCGLTVYPYVSSVHEKAQQVSLLM